MQSLRNERVHLRSVLPCFIAGDTLHLGVMPYLATGEPLDVVEGEQCGFPFSISSFSYSFHHRKVVNKMAFSRIHIYCVTSGGKQPRFSLNRQKTTGLLKRPENDRSRKVDTELKVSGPDWLLTFHARSWTMFSPVTAGGASIPGKCRSIVTSEMSYEARDSGVDKSLVLHRTLL